MALHILVGDKHAEAQCDIESAPYLRELGVSIESRPRRIQFTTNAELPVHRWAPYIQGFSADFVAETIERYAHDYQKGDIRLHVHDPFAGCGTVLVQAKMASATSTGTELNPLLYYLTKVKVSSWDVSADEVWRAYLNLSYREMYPPPAFLDTEKQFDPGALSTLRRIRAAIENVQDNRIRDLLNAAFAGILIECSRLKRTPCLGYCPGKFVSPDTPYRLFEARVSDIVQDLKRVQAYLPRAVRAFSKVYLTDAIGFEPQPTHLAITSPPYMNGLDYVMNYKIEMAWLGFASSQDDLRCLKNQMVACDNVSKSVTRRFSQEDTKYTDPWLSDILTRMEENIAHWGPEHKSRRIQRKRTGKPSVGYRRPDMPQIVHKYFDDMYKVLLRVKKSLLPGGRFVLVIGDSYVADVYIPTDLIIAKMGRQLGFQIESVEKARNRRSGQILTYRLRETVVTLRKPKQT